MLNLEDSKKEYYKLLEKIIARKGVKELSDYLIKHGLFEAPASTKFHLCSEGGLIIHMVGVTLLALQLRPVLYPEASEETVILTSIFHDCFKATDGIGNKTYLKYSESKERAPYLWNNEQLNYAGGHKSALIISKFVDLKQDEVQAIAYHDGPYTESWKDLMGNNNVYPLTHLIHMADMWSCWVVERNKNGKKYEKDFLGDR